MKKVKNVSKPGSITITSETMQSGVLIFTGLLRAIPFTMTQFLVIAVLLTSCTSKQYIVKNIEVVRVEMDSTWEPVADTEMRTLIISLKTKMTEEMQKVIGTANQTLIKDKPQSLLTNFTTDAMLDYASILWGPVDFAVMNVGGIRNTLNQGNVTVGDIYEIYPFDNRIVLLELTGKAIMELFDTIAKKGGEGLSKNIEVVIKDKVVESLIIGGKAVDENKIYRITTIDYLAEGNSGMEAFTKAVNVTDPNKFLRDVMIEYIKRLTAVNIRIDAHLDNRITIKK